MNRRIEIGGIAEFGDSSPFCIFVPDWLSKTSSVNTTRSQVRFLSSTRTGRTLAIAADAELHNKLDLASALGQPSLATSSDEELLIAAYSKWNEGCVKYLAGDYSFAIWDDSRKHLFCCRDHLGSRPFYYLWKASKFFFATDPRSIFEISGTAPELNRRKLADMAVFFSDCNYPEETLHSGIVGLPAATWLLVNERGIRQHTYWTPEILPDLVPPRPEDAFEALHHILSQSVENRIGDSRRVAVYFSGGLDSSALAALAATSLARGNHRLHALSSVLPTSHSPKLTDEREFIDEFRAWPNIDIEYISAPGRGPFDGIEDAARFALTPFVTSRTYLYDALEHGATADGDEVVLDGCGGELGLTSHGSGYSLELAATLRWFALLKQLREMRAVNACSPARVLARDVRNTFATESGQPLALLSPEFFSESHAVARSHVRSIRHRENQLTALKTWLRRRANRPATTANGDARVVYPLRDKRVLEFCISAPGSLKIRDGYRRYLVRGALQGILPDKICWRTSKSPFAPDYYVRYNAQLNKAKEFVAAIGPTDPVRSIVNVAELERSLYPVDEVRGTPAALTTIPGSFYLICFLRQFAEFRP